MRTILSFAFAIVCIQTHAQKLSQSEVGRYAKNFAYRMYNTEPCYGDKHTGFNFNILTWKAIRGNSGSYFYAVKVEATWKEGMGGIWGDWKDYVYKGIMVFDGYGCNPVFFITEKKEFTILGVNKRSRELDPGLKTAMIEGDPSWFKNIKWGWQPSGCLSDN